MSVTWNAKSYCHTVVCHFSTSTLLSRSKILFKFFFFFNYYYSLFIILQKNKLNLLCSKTKHSFFFEPCQFCYFGFLSIIYILLYLSLTLTCYHSLIFRKSTVNFWNKPIWSCQGIKKNLMEYQMMKWHRGKLL